MRLTVFWELMTRRFGAAYAESLARDVVLAALDGRTVLEGLEAGIDPKDVWLAVSEYAEVPVPDR